MNHKKEQGKKPQTWGYIPNDKKKAVSLGFFKYVHRYEMDAARAHPSWSASSRHGVVANLDLSGRSFCED